MEKDNIDRKHIEEIGGFKILEKIKPIFIECATKDILDLDGAVKIEDFEKINDLAHRLKGSCATIGAKKMAGICEGLEEVSVKNDISACIEMNNCLKLSYEDLKAEL